MPRGYRSKEQNWLPVESLQPVFGGWGRGQVREGNAVVLVEGSGHSGGDGRLKGPAIEGGKWTLAKRRVLEHGLPKPVTL